MTSPDRLHCCVPFCPRSIRDDGTKGEWICAEHWRAIPQKKRDAYSRVKRIAKRAGAWSPEAARIWRRMKAIAIQKAAGI